MNWLCLKLRAYNDPGRWGQFEAIVNFPEVLEGLIRMVFDRESWKVIHQETKGLADSIVYLTENLAGHWLAMKVGFSLSEQSVNIYGMGGKWLKDE